MTKEGLSKWIIKRTKKNTERKNREIGRRKNRWLVGVNNDLEKKYRED